MTFSERFREIRTGFELPFWVANISEIFERLSCYGAFASLALYLQEKLSFSTEQTGTLELSSQGCRYFSKYSLAKDTRLKRELKNMGSRPGPQPTVPSCAPAQH